jgi:hypothetical protein
MEIKKSKKGVLLTLVTVVLVVLMLAELVTYVYTNINYENVDSFSNVANNGYRFASTLNSSASSFLHTSLNNAVMTLVKYEGSGKRTNTQFLNSTAYALQSLILNGTLYGTNEITLMGGATLNNYTNAIILQASLQNMKLTISNASLQVYQTGPYGINATYTALIFLNTSSGPITYPLSASSGFFLNGSADLYGIQDNNNYTIAIANNYPAAALVGNAYAASGSSSPFQFIYGTVIVTNTLSACSGLPVQFENSNFILAAQNDQAGSCGFGGVVTYTPSAWGYNVPYLVYSSNSNIFNYLYNGTSLLLNGVGLDLLNVSALQSAMHNGAYYKSQFAPAYLDWAQGSISKRSQNGLFSFNLYNTEVMRSTQSAIAYVQIPNVAQTQLSTVTIAGWVNYRGPGIAYWNWMVTKSSAWSVGACGNMLIVCYYDWGSALEHDSNMALSRNTWYFIAATISGGTETVYINGANVLSNSLTISNQGVGIQIGNNDGAQPLNGSVADVQIYNSILTKQQIYQLYLNGIDGLPTSTNSLVGWWPLNGNPVDYSGNGYNGVVFSTANTIPFRYISGYSGDPVYDGSFYGGNLTNIIEGVSNCANLNRCSNSSLQHLYLGPGSLLSEQYSSLSGATSLGLASSVSAALFNGPNSYVSVPDSSAIDPVSAMTLSVWFYARTATPTGWNGIITKTSDYGGLTNGYGIRTFVSPNLEIEPWISGQADVVTTSTNTWHNAILTYTSGSGGIFYFDGKPAGTFHNTGGIIQPATPLLIGSGGFGSNNNFFDGSVANLQIYNTALSPAQAAALYASGAGASPVPGAGNVGWWPLSSNPNDYSGNGNNGNPTNVIYAAVGENATIPNAALFSGSGYLNVSNSVSLGANYITTSAWIDVPQGCGSYSVIINKENSYESAVTCGGSSATFEAAIMPNWAWYTSSQAIPFNTWTFVAVSWDGSTERYYVNGVLTNSYSLSSGTVTPSGQCVRIGARNCPVAAASYAFNGLIGDVQLYGTALSAAQVSQLYLNDSVMGVTPLGKWPLSNVYNGLMNQTADTANALNPGLLSNMQGICSNANVINNLCGVGLSQP